MKGLVFTEFLNMVEKRFSPDVCDRLIEVCEVPSAGYYIAEGIYDPQELTDLTAGLHALTGLPMDECLGDLGRRLFGRFVAAHPEFVEGMTSSADFLPHLHEGVHQEVARLYPGAKTPTFTCDAPEPGVIVMRYSSEADLPDMAEGMIHACIEHFGDSMTVNRETFPGAPPETVFTVRQV